MIVEDSSMLLDRGLRGEDVFQRAKISQTTFYRKFNKASFIDAVMDELVPQRPDVPTDLHATVLAALTANHGDPLATLRQVSTSEFDAVRGGAKSTRRLLAIALGMSRPRTAKRIRSLYQARDEASIEGYQALFESWGTTLRAPFTVRHLAVAITAIYDGFATRWRVEPDAFPDKLVGEVVLAFFASALDTEQRHQHVDDVAAPLANAVMESFQLSRSTDLPDDPRRAVVEAARHEISRRGYFMTNLELIATTSRVPLPTVKRLFPTKPHIIVGALKPSFDRLGESVQDDVTLGRPAGEVVERHLIRCARLVAEQPEFVDALIAVVAHDTYGEVESTIEIKKELNFPSLIAPVIADGQQAGIFSTALPAGEVAAAMTNTLFLRCFTRRQLSAEENGHFVCEMVLGGLRARD